MKNLGGFAVKLFKDGEDYCSEVNYEFHDAPNAAIVYGIMTLIMTLAEENPNYPVMLTKALAEYFTGKLGVKREKDKEDLK